jgi:ParB family chromosome partitioning protein
MKTQERAEKRGSGDPDAVPSGFRGWSEHEIVFLAPNALHPYERNPTLHPIEHVAQIVRSIKEFGFTVPVLVDEHDMILAGHGRQLAALDMELPEIPVIRRPGLSDAQKRAYVLADNKIARNAEFDWQLISGHLQELKEEGFDLDLTGFRDFEYQPLLEADWTPPALHDDKIIDDPDLHHIAVTTQQKEWIDRAHLRVNKENREDVSTGAALETICRAYLKK